MQATFSFKIFLVVTFKKSQKETDAVIQTVYII